MNVTILIADDNKRVRDVLRRVLSDGHAFILTAPDGDAVMAAARGWSLDLIILDVAMPGKSGIEVCAALKADAKTRDIPVLMLSGLTEIEQEEEGLHAGADGYLTKPFNQAELKRHVSSLLKLRAGRLLGKFTDSAAARQGGCL